MKSIQNLTLDIENKGFPKHIYAKQGDSGRLLNVTLTKDGKAVTPENGAEAKFRAVKPDGLLILNGARINEDGTVTAELTRQTLAVKGAAYADIQITGKNGEVLSTVNFIIDIEGAPNGKIGESANELLALASMIEKGGEILNDCLKVLDGFGELGNAGEIANAIKWIEETLKVLENVEEISEDEIDEMFKEEF